jgi:hypothetical protein
VAKPRFDQAVVGLSQLGSKVRLADNPADHPAGTRVSSSWVGRGFGTILTVLELPRWDSCPEYGM